VPCSQFAYVVKAIFNFSATSPWVSFSSALRLFNLFVNILLKNIVPYLSNLVLHEESKRKQTITWINYSK
jgi:hypothetical protein